jgi:hypothetical protein
MNCDPRLKDEQGFADPTRDFRFFESADARRFRGNLKRGGKVTL